MILLKGSVNVVAIEISNSCKKLKLPNGKVVDILSSVFEEMQKWVQDSAEKLEAGGYIVGYQHSGTNNITLEEVSRPYMLDKRSRIRFSINDPRHKLFLLNQKRKKSFYMGVWHTHPQVIPTPSSIDWKDWYETLKVDKTCCDYVFFIIVGIRGIRVWIGDFHTKTIVEIFEYPKRYGIYQKS